MSSPKVTDIRLQNTSQTNLSLHLHQLRPASRGSMRRGPMLTPILIGAGGHYDVCSHLKCTLEEARRIVAHSPEVQHFARGNRLAIMDWPPADAPSSEPPQLVENATATPAETPPPMPPPPAPEPEPAPEPVAAESELVPEMRELATEDPTPIPGPATRKGEPNMDWAEDELRFYAMSKNIDISKAKSKTQILRSIKGAK